MSASSVAAHFYQGALEVLYEGYKVYRGQEPQEQMDWKKVAEGVFQYLATCTLFYFYAKSKTLYEERVLKVKVLGGFPDYTSERPTLDPVIENFYSLGEEQGRLDTHTLEKVRTLDLLKRYLPNPPAIIYDVGGGAGAYAFPLAEEGYEVHLIDPVPLHITQAKELNVRGEVTAIELGDARKIERENCSADGVLFFGPLYHLPELNDRLQALNEAHRVLKPGGILCAVGISRFAPLITGMYKNTIYDKMQEVEECIMTGVHKRNFYSYHHLPQELVNELVTCLFKRVTLHGVEGPVWDKPMLYALQKDEENWKRLLNLLEEIECDKSLLGANGHFMAIGYK